MNPYNCTAVHLAGVRTKFLKYSDDHFLALVLGIRKPAQRNRTRIENLALRLGKSLRFDVTLGKSLRFNTDGIPRMWAWQRMSQS